jgi:phage recombination protein Bet
MSTTITRMENATPIQSWTDSQKALIKRQIAAKATDDELEMFMYLANKNNLDPFSKEIWFIKYKDDDKPLIFTSRDGYLKIAHSHPAFDGMESYTIDNEKGEPIKGVCTVYRRDMTHPFKAEAKVKEYKKNSQIWNQYPSIMIQKVAEVIALKRAFSINGLVTQEELSMVEDEVKSPTSKEEVKPAIPLTISDSQIKSFNAKAKNNNWTDSDINEFVKETGFESVESITQSQFPKLFNSLVKKENADE